MGGNMVVAEQAGLSPHRQNMSHRHKLPHRHKMPHRHIFPHRHIKSTPCQLLDDQTP
jgi:hypothetical protein